MPQCGVGDAACTIEALTSRCEVCSRPACRHCMLIRDKRHTCFLCLDPEDYVRSCLLGKGGERMALKTLLQQEKEEERVAGLHKALDRVRLQQEELKEKETALRDRLHKAAVPGRLWGPA